MLPDDLRREHIRQIVATDGAQLTVAHMMKLVKEIKKASRRAKKDAVPDGMPDKPFKLITGDLAEVRGIEADCIITDPPYGQAETALHQRIGRQSDPSIDHMSLERPTHRIKRCETPKNTFCCSFCGRTRPLCQLLGFDGGLKFCCRCTAALECLVHGTGDALEVLRGAN